MTFPMAAWVIGAAALVTLLMLVGFLAAFAWCALEITIHGKMRNGLSRKDAWREMTREALVILAGTHSADTARTSAQDTCWVCRQPLAPNGDDAMVCTDCGGRNLRKADVPENRFGNINS